MPLHFLGVGDGARIESGPLRGLEGFLVEFKGNRQLVVSVSLLQRSVAIEVDSASMALRDSFFGQKV